MNQIKKYFIIILLLELLLSYAPAFAQSPAPLDYSQSGVQNQITKYLCTPSTVDPSQQALLNGAGPLTGPGTFQQGAAFNNSNSGDLYKCINQIYKFAIVLASVVGVFFIVIAGWVYMSSNGDKEAVDKAKSILTSTITSLVILLAGYVLLKAINPDLIQFQSIQPPSVKISDLPQMAAPNNVMVSLSADGSVPTKVSGGVGITAADQLTTAGCIFQTPKQHDEAQYMTQALFDKIKSLCSDVSSSGSGKPAISSVIGEGQHAADSYHYKGCATDFADTLGNGFFDFASKTGRPIGKAIYDAAIKEGFSQDRIDPGSDRTQTFHIHVDLGSSCPSK